MPTPERQDDDQLLRRENAALRRLLSRILANFQYEPEMACYRISEIAWFNQPYMFKRPALWLQTELAAIKKEFSDDPPA